MILHNELPDLSNLESRFDKLVKEDNQVSTLAESITKEFKVLLREKNKN